MIQRPLIIGGANGIGLAIATAFSHDDAISRVSIVDKLPVCPEHMHSKFETFCFDLTEDDYSFFDRFTDVDAVMVTAGFGYLQTFADNDENVITKSFAVNAIPPLRIAHRFYPRLLGKEPFRMGIMSSITGFLSSPFYAVYGATKAALRSFIESVNAELTKTGTSNRILCVAPGSISGTSFNGQPTHVEELLPLAQEIIIHLEHGDDLFIPHYDDIFRAVLQRYHEDFRAEGLRSYDYKVRSGRIALQPPAISDND